MFVVKKDFYLLNQELGVKLEFQCISHFGKEKDAEKALDAILVGLYRGFVNIVEIKGSKCNFCNTYFPQLGEPND